MAKPKKIINRLYKKTWKTQISLIIYPYGRKYWLAKFSLISLYASYSINRVKGVIKSIYMTNARIAWLKQAISPHKEMCFFWYSQKAKILGEKNMQSRIFGKIAYFWDICFRCSRLKVVNRTCLGTWN